MTNPLRLVAPTKSLNIIQHEVELNKGIALSADCAIFGFAEHKLKVLLIRCDIKQFKGQWSLLGDLIHPDDLPAIQNVFINGMENPGVTQFFECRFRHKDCSWRLIEATGINLLDDPAVSGIIVNSRDITNVFFPAQPIPARCANSRSKTGPVST